MTTFIFLHLFESKPNTIHICSTLFFSLTREEQKRASFLGKENKLPCVWMQIPLEFLRTKMRDSGELFPEPTKLLFFQTLSRRRSVRISRLINKVIKSTNY